MTNCRMNSGESSHAQVGKHGVIASSQTKIGKHGAITSSQHSPWHIILAALLAIGLALVPITIAWSHVSLDSQAFADSTRSAFSELNDASPKTEMISSASSPENAVDYTSHIGAIMQNSVMSGGCEIVSLGIALESMGIEADLDVIVSKFLDIDGHFSTGYSGNPYSQGAGYPPGICAAANGYLESLNLKVRAHDLTGSSFDEIASLTSKGYPVLVWTTMGFGSPQFTGAYDQGAQWYDNEHCVVLYGFDKDNALVSDPLDGLVSRDAKQFARIYEECGSMALAIY